MTNNVESYVRLPVDLGPAPLKSDVPPRDFRDHLSPPGAPAPVEKRNSAIAEPHTAPPARNERRSPEENERPASAPSRQVEGETASETGDEKVQDEAPDAQPPGEAGPASSQAEEQPHREQQQKETPPQAESRSDAEVAQSGAAEGGDSVETGVPAASSEQSHPQDEARPNAEAAGAKPPSSEAPLAGAVGGNAQAETAKGTDNASRPAATSSPRDAGRVDPAPPEAAGSQESLVPPAETTDESDGAAQQRRSDGAVRAAADGAPEAGATDHASSQEAAERSAAAQDSRDAQRVTHNEAGRRENLPSTPHAAGQPGEASQERGKDRDAKTTRPRSAEGAPPPGDLGSRIAQAARQDVSEPVTTTTGDQDAGEEPAVRFSTEGEQPVKATSSGGESHSPATARADGAGERLPSLFSLSRAPQNRQPPPLTDAQQTRLVQRVAKAFDVAQARGESTVRLRLSPPELGSLRLEVQVESGSLIARLEVETQTTRDVLLENLHALRHRLAEQNIRVDQFDVDLLDRHASQNWDEQKRQPSHRQGGAGEDVPAGGGSPEANANDAPPETTRLLEQGNIDVVI